jgi:hypothetical protein
MNGWRDSAVLLAFFFAVLCLFGLQYYNLKTNYVRKDEVREIFYNLLANRQTRDDQILFSQVQWMARYIVQYHPKTREKLDEYQEYWNQHAIEMWMKWETK